MRTIRILHFSDFKDFDDDEAFLKELIDNHVAKIKDQSGVEIDIEYKHTGSPVDQTEYSKYHIVVIDYGGIGCCGLSGLVDSYDREFSQAIEENPNTEFVVVSAIPNYFLEDEYLNAGFPNFHTGFESVTELISESTE